MIRFGIVSPPVSGHLNPFAALGRELQARGHHVTVFHMADVEKKVRDEGLDFVPIGASDHARGSLPESLARLGRLKGLAALRFTIRAVARTSEMFCRDLPAALRAERIDVLLVDQMEPAGGAVADRLGLPFATICNALPINRDPIAPPPFTPWTYRDTPLSAIRNRVGYAVSDWLTAPIANVVARYRREWRLPVHRNPDDSFSQLAQISQMPQALDFPRRSLPGCFHYVGPIRDSSPSTVPFPWDRLDGRPLIYASLGTLQNGRLDVFHCFAEACRGLDVQLVISHGGGLTAEQAATLADRALVVGYAPQTQLLPRCALTITHAGLNTVLDSLAAGVPLVAVPINYEQPAIARRVEWAGVGRAVMLSQLSPRFLGRLVSEMLADTQYGEAARRFRQSAPGPGASQAGSLVEGVYRARSESLVF